MLPRLLGVPVQRALGDAQPLQLLLRYPMGFGCPNHFGLCFGLSRRFLDARLKILRERVFILDGYRLKCRRVRYVKTHGASRAQSCPVIAATITTISTTP